VESVARVLIVFSSKCSVFEAELADVIPVCHTTIAGTRIVGRLTAGQVVYLDFSIYASHFSNFFADEHFFSLSLQKPQRIASSTVDN